LTQCLTNCFSFFLSVPSFHYFYICPFACTQFFFLISVVLRYLWFMFSFVVPLLFKGVWSLRQCFWPLFDTYSGSQRSLC